MGWEYAQALADDVKECHERISDLEKRLEQAEADRNRYRLKYSQERLHVAALRREQREDRELVVPCGDADEGYECPTCCAPLGELGEWRYCPGCGAKIDWDTYDAYAASALADAAEYAFEARREEALLCS